MTASRRALLLLLLVLLCCCGRRDAILTPSLCDTGECTCPTNNWGLVACICSTQQEVVLSARTLPTHATTVRVEQCARVEVATDAVHGLQNLRRVELRDIGRLELQTGAFSRRPESETYTPRENPEVIIERCNVTSLPSYAFRGPVAGVALRAVRVDSVASFAFASLSGMKYIELRDSVLSSVDAQAFKKFAVDKLVVVGTVFSGAVPSRAVADLEVVEELVLERVRAQRLQSGSLLVRGPLSVRIAGCTFNHTSGDAFKVEARGPVTVQDNVFLSLDAGAFLGLSVDRRTLRDQGRQDLLFRNNSLSSFRSGALDLNGTAFVTRVEGLRFVGRPCSCEALAQWRAQLKVSEEVELRCGDLESCASSAIAWDGGLVLGVGLGVGVLLIVIFLAVLCAWRRRKRRKSRGRRWVSEPARNKKDHEAMQSVGLVLPDGRTYRETELHVIVERAEPLIEDK